MKKFFLALLILAIGSLCEAQTPPGGYGPNIGGNTSSSGGITQVTSLPASCTATSAPLLLTQAYSTYAIGIYECGIGGVYTPDAGSWDQSVDVRVYGAKFDVQYCLNATLNSTTTVTCGVNDPPFSCPLGVFPCSTPGFGSDVGKAAFAMSSPAFIQGNITTTACPQTTISTVTNTHAVVLANACTSTISPAGFWWGTDDTTAMRAADVAASNICGNLLMPSGSTFASGGYGNTSMASYCDVAGGSSRTSKTVMGAGRNATRIIALPNFDYNTTTSCNGLIIFSYNGCFFSKNNYNLHDFMITGVGFGPSGNTRNTSAISLGGSGLNSTISNVEVTMWNGTDTTTVGIAVSGSATGVNSVEVDGAGFRPLFVGGPWVTIAGSPCFFGDTVSGVLISANNVTSLGCQYSSDNLQANDFSMKVTGGSFFSFGDTFASFNQAHATTRGLECDALCSLNGDLLDLSSSPTGAVALFVNNAAAIVNLNNTTLKATNTTGQALFISSGKVFDNGGNTILTTSANTIPANSYFGEANSSNITTLTIAKTVLSAGWGSTAAVTSPLGGNSPVQFTITNSGTGQGASPTVTYTFPTPYQVAPFSCTATQIGGTNATGTFTSSTPSATSVVFTFSLTPTAASTEIVQVTCVTP